MTDHVVKALVTAGANPLDVQRPTKMSLEDRRHSGDRLGIHRGQAIPKVRVRRVAYDVIPTGLNSQILVRSFLAPPFPESVNQLRPLVCFARGRHLLQLRNTQDRRRNSGDSGQGCALVFHIETNLIPRCSKVKHFFEKTPVVVAARRRRSPKTGRRWSSRLAPETTSRVEHVHRGEALSSWLDDP